MATNKALMMLKKQVMQQLHAAAEAYHSKDLVGAEAILKKILAINPNEPNALHLLGCINKDYGQLKRAINLIQASIREDGNNAIPFINLGKILIMAGQFEDAACAFEASLKRSRQIPETWFCLGNALREMNKLKDARQAYQEALQLSPSHAAAASCLGALLADEGELDEAEKLFVKALVDSPNNVSLRINYGKLLAQKDQHTSALLQYRLAIPFASQSPELYYNIATALKQKGELKEAIVYYEKTIEVKPDFADAHLNLGAALMETGKSNEAIICFRKAIEVKPDFAVAFLFLGNALKKDGELDEAITCFRKAIKLKPGCVDSLSELAHCLIDNGQLSEGLLVYKQCLQINPWDSSKFEQPAKLCDNLWKSYGDLRLRNLSIDLYTKSFQVRSPISSFIFASTAFGVGLPSIDEISHCLPANAELLPSFRFLHNPQFLSLYYLHIPKNGGLRFTVPLQECVRLYEDSLFNGKFDAWGNVLDLQHSYKRLTALRLNNTSIRDAFYQYLLSVDPNSDIDWSLIMSHGSWPSVEIQQLIADLTGQMPIRLGTWREPRERFISALHYLYRESGGSVNRVIKDLTGKNPFLHNAIYRYVMDCTDKELTVSESNIVVDYLLELGDHSLLSQLQSSFLSRNQLPNLIVSKRFNSAGDVYRMPSSVEDQLLSEFPIEEFIGMDESDVVNSLTVSHLPLELSCQPIGEELHPLTVIVSDSTTQQSSRYHSEICLTADLVGARGRQKLDRIFTRKNI